MTKDMQTTCLVTVLFILVALTWGTTWMAMKIAVGTIPPIYATALRFLAASPFLFLITKLTHNPLLFPKGERKFQIVVCLAYFAVPFTLMIYGEYYVSSALASIIFANMPIAVLITSILLLNEKVRLIQLLGLLIGVVSLSVILWQESSNSSANDWRGIAALLAAVVIHAIMYAKCKKHCKNISVLTFNTLPCLGAGIILFFIGHFVEKPNFALFSSASLLAVGYLGVIAGVCGILCYFTLQQKATAFQASLVFLVFPVIAIVLEKIINDTTITHSSLWLILPLLCGILLTLLPKRKIKQFMIN